MQTDGGGELDLFAIIGTWWARRVRIMLLALAGAVVGVAIFAAVYALRESHQEATVTFQLPLQSIQFIQF
jgi:uncharacterized protein with ACT and thioredoxin-like domain